MHVCTIGSFKDENKDERRSVSSTAASSCQKRIDLFWIRVTAWYADGSVLATATDGGPLASKRRASQ